METTLEIAPEAVSKVLVKQQDFNHALEYDIKPVCDFPYFHHEKFEEIFIIPFQLQVCLPAATVCHC